MNRKLLPLILIFLILTSCTKEDPIETEVNDLTEYDFEVIDYFKEISLGFEFGEASKITRRWQSDMKVYIGGDPKPELVNEFEKIKNEINTLVSTDFKIERVNDSVESNYYMFFGSKNQFDKIYPQHRDLTEDNWGLFFVSWNASQNLRSGRMYVDIERANVLEQKHILREELTQSLGLARDSNMYPESIFQSSWTTTIGYSELDKDLIRLLYHPSMRSGLGDFQVEELLMEILSAEN